MDENECKFLFRKIVTCFLVHAFFSLAFFIPAFLSPAAFVPPLSLRVPSLNNFTIHWPFPSTNLQIVPEENCQMLPMKASAAFIVHGTVCPLKPKKGACEIEHCERFQILSQTPLCLKLLLFLLACVTSKMLLCLLSKTCRKMNISFLAYLFRAVQSAP